MRAVLLVSSIAVIGHTTVAGAQARGPAQRGGIKLSDVAGTWDVKSMAGPKDSVVVPSVVTATADGKGWTMKLANREPIPVRVVAVGGDSVVTEAGPFESVLRPGQMVTTHTVAHYKGDTMSGTIEARYASGDIIRLKTAATRRK
ncbi:MAG: hypothetical protein AUH78_04670 [Gemmatimonadetes bacterium 13_1_40CM_4_69_8]|nr:MAG: hypothetical protein AUH78_04670 [Gemmatimonadetes bacterium 13_1_40CM_4_69_8]